MLNHWEVSAKDGSNVKNMFDDVISKLMESNAVVIKPRESNKTSSSESRLSYDFNQQRLSSLGLEGGESSRDHGRIERKHGKEKSKKKDDCWKSC